MNAVTEAFLKELSEHPKFQAAVAANQVPEGCFEGLEQGLRALYAFGAEHPKALDLWDELSAFLRRKDRTLKERLNKYVELLTENQPKLEAWTRENERPAHNH